MADNVEVVIVLEIGRESLLFNAKYDPKKDIFSYYIHPNKLIIIPGANPIGFIFDNEIKALVKSGDLEYIGDFVDYCKLKHNKQAVYQSNDIKLRKLLKDKSKRIQLLDKALSIGNNIIPNLDFDDGDIYDAQYALYDDFELPSRSVRKQPNFIKQKFKI